MELPRLARAPRSTAVLAALVAVLLLWPPTAAHAAPPPSSSSTTPVLDADPLHPPPGHRLNGSRVRSIAARAPAIAAELRRHPGLRAYVYTRGPTGWQVSWFTPGPHGRELALVYLSDRTGRVTEAWTGFQVAWTMARGYPGAFGEHLTAWYVWIGLCLMYAAAFLPRRWRETGLAQLDAAVLLALSVSLAFFDHGRIGLSVPLAVPPLLYLGARMLALAAGRGRPSRPPSFLVPASWLVVALLFLVGFRVALNVADANVIDVGYSGVVGADRLIHGQPLYGGWPSSIRSGDTYGPVNDAAYVPFRLVAGWSGTWDDLPAAHLAAVTFDLLTLASLFLLGRLARGPDTGVRLAYLWAACPFTALALESDSNDALVALLLVLVLLAMRWRSASLRGGLVALAGLTKFAPLALAPLFWRGLGERGPSARSLAGFAGGFTVAALVALLPVLLGGDDELATFWRHTIVYQANRGSPFSVWGLWGGLGLFQRIVQGGAAALAVAAFWLPRRRTLDRVAAMGAAVLIAVQLGLTHWFYLYLPWFLPLLFAAVELAPSRAALAATAPAAAPARSPPPASALRSG